MHQNDDRLERVVINLNKDLKQLISNAQTQVLNLENEITNLCRLQLLSKAEHMIDIANVEFSRVHYRFVPESLISAGLMESIKELITNIENKNDLVVELKLPEKDPCLLQEQLVNIYQIIFEVVCNVIFHAQAKYLYIKIENTANQLYVFITDDGIGCDSTKNKYLAGPGIQKINSCIKNLNATLEVISSSGFGTAYSIQIPK